MDGADAGAHGPSGRQAVRTAVATEGAPKAIGPYSQGVRAGAFVFTAGQVGLDPATGRLVEGGVGPETGRALANLASVLVAAGSGLDHVVKTTVYLADMADFPEMNQAYAAFFPDSPPARSTLAARALPAGGRVEIEAIGVITG